MYQDGNKYKLTDIQHKLFDKIVNAVDNYRYIFIEAPTGTGKTTSSIAATIKYLDMGYKILYLCRSHSLSEKVVNIVKEEIFLRKAKHKIKVINLRGRHSICPEYFGSNLCLVPCTYLGTRFECIYYNNLISNFGQALTLFNRNKNKSFNEIIDILISNYYCPYYVIKEITKESSFIVANYFYVLSGYSYNTYDILNIDPRNTILIIDEAHNIPMYTYDTNTIRINTDLTWKKLSVNKEGTHKIIEKALNLLTNLIYMQSKGVTVLEYISRYLNDIQDICLSLHHLIIQRYRKMKGIHKEEIGLIYSLLLAFEALLSDPLTYDIYAYDNNIIIHIKDISKYIWEKVSKFYKVLFISATLQPLLLLLEKEVSNRSDAFYISYTTLPSDIKLNIILIKGVSTRYRERSMTLFETYYRILRRILLKHEGPVIAFAASKSIIEGIRVCSKWDNNIVNMEETENIYIKREKKVYFFSQRGKWREGIDFDANVIAIVGLSYPYAAKENRVRYMLVYGSKFRWVMLIDSIVTAVQSLGRILRKSGEYYIYLIDDRFSTRYCLSLMPKWIRKKLKIIHYNDFLVDN